MAKLTDRYAEALLEISEENGCIERDLEQAVFIRDTLKGAEVQAFLLQQDIPDSAKRKLFSKAFSDRIPWHLMGFLYLMVKDNREALIVPVLNEYIDRINRRFGKTVAKVVSAKALTESQIDIIRRVLSKKTNMQVEVEVTVDPDVIGGFYVLLDGQSFDGTVRSELNTMRQSLERGIMNECI